MKTGSKGIQEGDKTEIIVSNVLKKKVLSVYDLFNGKVRPTKLQSILLRIHEKTVQRMEISSIGSQYGINRFVKPSDVNQKELVAFDNLAYSIIPDDFEPVELSPVSCLGANSKLAGISQKTVLSTIRNTEVVPDITMALALECARRRKEIIGDNPKSCQIVNLCSSHRSIRLQVFSKESGFTSHFRAFGVCSAGRDIGHQAFERQCLILHLGFYLNLLMSLNEAGYDAEDITVYFSDIRITEAIIKFFHIPRERLMRNTQTRGFEPFADRVSYLPKTVDSISEITSCYGELSRFTKYLIFLETLESKVINYLREKFRGIRFKFDLHRIAGMGYYTNLCFKITARNKEGKEFPLADGGLADWTQKLLSSRKERLFTSGFGSELFCRNFKKL